MITHFYGDARDVLATLEPNSVHLCVTSPPYYGLRAYTEGDEREIGREATPEAYLAALVDVFRAVRRVLRDDGVLVLNLGDSFGADKQKMLIPHRAALALQADGWIVRQDMPWIKRNAMPESVADRPTTAHEYLFVLVKSPRYWWDAEAIRVAHVRMWDESNGGNLADVGHKKNGKIETKQTHPKGYPLPNPAGRNYRSTDPWFTSLDLAIDDARTTLAALERLKARGGVLEDDGDILGLQVNPTPYSGAHYAVFPPALVEPFIKAACPRECCPHCGAGWVRVVERETNWHERKAAGAWAGNVGVSATYQNGVHGADMSHDLGTTTKRIDRGFRPSCACPAHDSVPGVVLDPFGGSGTTGRVAIAQGRRAILIDLNDANATLQAERTNGVQMTLPEA